MPALQHTQQRRNAWDTWNNSASGRCAGVCAVLCETMCAIRLAARLSCSYVQRCRFVLSATQSAPCAVIFSKRAGSEPSTSLRSKALFQEIFLCGEESEIEEKDRTSPECDEAGSGKKICPVDLSRRHKQRKTSHANKRRIRTF